MEYESFEYKGKKIRIEYDEECLNPFEEWDWPETLCIRQLGRNSVDPILEGDMPISDLRTFLKWIDGGDSAFLCANQSCEGCHNFNDCGARDKLSEIHDFEKDYHYLPLFKYEHSGVAYNTVGFSSPWDSGLVGFISISKKEFEEEGFQATPDEYLKHTVELLSSWANGECYGYIIENEEGEHEDSCWGYYGHEGAKAAEEDARVAVDFPENEV